MLHDIDVYLQGINAYSSARGGGSAPFARTDVYAFNALKDQFVGEGGGDEAVHSEFLSSLQKRLGKRRGLAVWNDLAKPTTPRPLRACPALCSYSRGRRALPETSNWMPEACHQRQRRRLPLRASFAVPPATLSWFPGRARPRTIRSWSRVRRSATTTPANLGSGRNLTPARVVSAMNAAATHRLAAKQGSNPSKWRASATAEQITFIPGLLPYKMRYTNRPSGIQQVISFGGHAPRDTGR